MRRIKQEGTSWISIRSHNSDTDVGLIMQSTVSRKTEIDATSNPYLLHTEVITDKPPHPGDCWCSNCGWRPANRFGKNAARKSGVDNYCLECRKRLRDHRKNNQTGIDIV